MKRARGFSETEKKNIFKNSTKLYLPPAWLFPTCGGSGVEMSGESCRVDVPSSLLPLLEESRILQGCSPCLPEPARASPCPRSFPFTQVKSHLPASR